MKKLKLRIAKFDKLLVVEQLKMIGEFEETDHVKVDDDLFLFDDHIDLQENIDDKSANCIEFDDNEERDEYAANLINWITEEQFGGAGKLEIGKPCLFRDRKYEEWTEYIYAGKVAKQLGTEKRHLACEDPELDEFYRWKYAKPLNSAQLTIDGEIYTWEVDERGRSPQKKK